MGRATQGHDRERCIRNCQDAARACFETAMTRCLEEGGEHLDPEHFRLMMSCAALCRAAADLLLMRSPFSSQLCELCESACQACAASCRSIGGMELCARACEACAESCSHMARPESATTTLQREPLLTQPQPQTRTTTAS